MDLTTLPTHPVTGLTAIGFVNGRPVWPVAGAAEETGADEPDGDEEDETGEGDGEGDADEAEQVDWQAKFTELQAQHEASQAKLARANAQAKKLREAAKVNAPAAPTPAVPAAVSARTGTARQQPTAAEPQVVAVQDDAEIGRLQTAAVRAYAKAALLAAGCDPELIDAPLSRLKATEVDWDEDEDEPILDDFIDDMKARYAKAFARPEPVAAASRPGARRAGSIDQGAANGSGNGRPAPKEMSFGERLWQSGQGDVRAPRRGR